MQQSDAFICHLGHCPVSKVSRASIALQSEQQLALPLMEVLQEEPGQGSPPLPPEAEVGGGAAVKIALSAGAQAKPEEAPTTIKHVSDLLAGKQLHVQVRRRSRIEQVPSSSSLLSACPVSMYPVLYFLVEHSLVISTDITLGDHSLLDTSISVPAFPQVVSAKDLMPSQMGGLSSPYCVMMAGMEGRGGRGRQGREVPIVARRVSRPTSFTLSAGSLNVVCGFGSTVYIIIKIYTSL